MSKSNSRQARGLTNGPLDDWSSIDSPTTSLLDSRAIPVPPVAASAPNVTPLVSASHPRAVAKPLSSTFSTSAALHNYEDRHDDKAVEDMLSTEKGLSPDASTLAPDVAPLPAVDLSVSCTGSCVDLTQDDACSISSDATARDDFYAAQDDLYAAQNGSRVSEDGFLPSREKSYHRGESRTTRRQVYIPRGSFYATKDLSRTIPKNPKLASSARGSNVAQEHIQDQDLGSGIAWEGGSFGELQFDKQPQGYWAGGSTLAKWTFGDNDPTSVAVVGRSEGDVHISQDGLAPLACWVCVLNSSGIPDWVEISEGDRHPFHK
ncbi:hypothetical protein FRC09_012909, partial [Ceratobasidium sp. 395]